MSQETANQESQASQDAGAFVLSVLRPSSFPHLQGGRAHLNAYLEDYAAVAGLIALYEATFELRWLEAAPAWRRRSGRIPRPRRRGFFQVSADHEKLVVRRKDFMDSAVPSGNSLAAELFLRLAVLLGDDTAGSGARRGDPAADGRGMGEQPLAFGRLLCALDSTSIPAGDRDRRRPGRGRHAGAAGRGPAALSAEQRPGARRARRYGCARADPVAGGRSRSRPGDRLRVPELRLQPAGHRAGGVGSTVGSDSSGIMVMVMLTLERVRLPHIIAAPCAINVHIIFGGEAWRRLYPVGPAESTPDAKSTLLITMASARSSDQLLNGQVVLQPRPKSSAARNRLQASYYVCCIIPVEIRNRGSVEIAEIVLG